MLIRFIWCHLLGAEHRIHSSQKKATDFISTNLYVLFSLTRPLEPEQRDTILICTFSFSLNRSHTLDFFSQALPTPNFNNLAGHPSTPPATATSELDGDNANRGFGQRQMDTDLRRRGQDAQLKNEPEDGETTPGGMDIPWNW